MEQLGTAMTIRVLETGASLPAPLVDKKRRQFTPLGYL